MSGLERGSLSRLPLAMENDGARCPKATERGYREPCGARRHIKLTASGEKRYLIKPELQQEYTLFRQQGSQAAHLNSYRYIHD